MKLFCPDCREPIRAGDVNLSNGLAKCMACDNVFRFHEQIPPAGIVSRPAVGARLEIPLPKGLKMGRDGRTTSISRRWFDSPFTSISMLFLSALLDATMISMLSEALAAGGGLADLFGPSSMVWLPFVAITAAVNYVALSSVLNRSELKIDAETVLWHHTPLPWRGNRRFHIGAIEQFYVFENTEKRGPRGAHERRYDLMVLLKGNRAQCVASGLKTPEQALFMKQELQRTLGIKPIFVPGEYCPPPHLLPSGEAIEEAGAVSLSSLEDGNPTVGGLSEE